MLPCINIAISLVDIPPPKKINEETSVSDLIFYAHSQCNENVQFIKKFALQTFR